MHHCGCRISVNLNAIETGIQKRQNALKAVALLFSKQE
jgi:hypothetical protein